MRYLSLLHFDILFMRIIMLLQDKTKDMKELYLGKQEMNINIFYQLFHKSTN